MIQGSKLLLFPRRLERMMCRGKCAVLGDFVCCCLVRCGSCALCCLSKMRYAAYVLGTVTSHARGFPRFQGIKVAPSGLFPSIRERSIGSLVGGIWALLTALQIRSLSLECLACLGPLFRHDRPWSPLASTIVPQMHMCGWQVIQPSLDPTIIIIIIIIILFLFFWGFFSAPASTKPAGYKLLDNVKIVDCDGFLDVVFVEGVEERQRITPLNGHW